MFNSIKEFEWCFKNKLEVLHGKSIETSSSPEQFHTLGTMLREHISNNWLATNEQYRFERQKEVYYFSIEFLLGKLLKSYLIQLGLRELCEKGLLNLGISLGDLEEFESDAGLGNGGLGRLAACFLDSLASQDLPGHGCGIRYKNGFFDQKIIDGHQVELPDQWLKHGNVWEERRDEESVEVFFGGEVESYYSKNNRLEFRLNNAEVVTAVPYDMPIVGYDTNTVNTLRLWSAEVSSHSPNKSQMKYKRETESISESLYPDDSNYDGKLLRLKQQYFLVSASLQRIVESYKENYADIRKFHEKIAIHVNDTHPVLAIPEFMRILIDIEKISWEEAWEITKQTFSYTNHTILSEALEKWSIDLFKALLPRIYMIVEEINERYCNELWNRYPGDWNRISQMAIIENGFVKMAHLAIVGSNSVNGVAEIHTEILIKKEMKLFYEYEPNKFNNKTNGITHRRWLLQSNPELSNLIIDSIGKDWIVQPTQLEKLLNFQQDNSFMTKFIDIKKKRKEILANYIHYSNGIAVDTDSIFDIHIKRLHAYKRQLLNVLHIMYLYNRLKNDSHFSMHPRTFIFGAKSAPSYYFAKKVIKLIHSVANIVNNDPYINQFIKVIFIENYRVSLAELIIPAADVSEQISTASKEASGTSNMKFMMNGALTLGTLDGANIEILREVGEDNIFTFGLTAEEVLHYNQYGGYNSIDYYHYDTRIKKILDQLLYGLFPLPKEEFETIFDSLMSHNDEYFVLKDFSSYVQAHEDINNTYLNKNEWAIKSLHNTAKSGIFTSDNTIQKYASEIWKIDQKSLQYC